MQDKLNCEHALISISVRLCACAFQSFEVAYMNAHRNVLQRGASVLRETISSGRELTLVEEEEK